MIDAIVRPSAGSTPPAIPRARHTVRVSPFKTFQVTCIDGPPDLPD